MIKCLNADMRLTCWEAAVVGLQVFKDARQGSEVRTTFVLSSHTLLPSHLQETQKDNTKQNYGKLSTVVPSLTIRDFSTSTF